MMNFSDCLLMERRADRCFASNNDRGEGFTKGNKKQMATEEKILTKHPLGKSGKNINRKSYETVKEALLSALNGKQLTHSELFDRIGKRLKGKFEGNISWYAETVKLDLEARKIIDRTASKPQKYRVR